MDANRDSGIFSAAMVCCCFPALADAHFDSAPSTKDMYGAHFDLEGWLHFGLHSPDAEQVNLLLFDAPDATTPAHVIPMQRHDGDWRISLRNRQAFKRLIEGYGSTGDGSGSPASTEALAFREFRRRSRRLHPA